MAGDTSRPASPAPAVKASPFNMDDWAAAPLEDDDWPTFESGVDADGMKVVTSYQNNAAGDSIKIERKIRVHNTFKKINRTALNRRAKMMEHPANADAAKDHTCENLEAPFEFNKSAEDMDDDYQFADLDKARPLSLRRKFNEFRDAEDKIKEESEQQGEEVGDTGETVTKKYVAPKLRGGQTLQSTADDLTSVKVSNLSEDVKEIDLEELFGGKKIGNIKKIFLAKHKETGTPKGFAYITYQTRASAEAAIRNLHRHGYDNRILSVEWAKPSNKDKEKSLK